MFPGSDLANCQFMATDIQTCQAAGKIITLSMGGATGADTFTSESQAEDFADLIWDLFLGGTSSTRPFGDAVSLFSERLSILLISFRFLTGEILLLNSF